MKFQIDSLLGLLSNLKVVGRRPTTASYPTIAQTPPLVA
jgi:hypothetical protein